MRLHFSLAMLAVAVAFASPAAACTTFCVRGSDGMVFGRNYDYPFGDGLVLVNPRSVAKTSLIEHNPARWVSRYGNVTFNQYGKDSPMGGINEKGLVVEVMQLDESRFPAVDSRPAMGSLEWIQRLLDTSASVEEALQAAKKVRIGFQGSVHFLLADRGGDSATVEFLNGRMVIRRGDTLPDRVLANSSYDDSNAYLKKAQPEGSPLPRGLEGSLERFARASRMVRALEGDAKADRIGRSFEILDRVAQPGHTQWQIVYDLPRAAIHYRTTANRERRSIELAGLDFRCKSAGSMLDVDTGRGDVTAALMPYAPEANERLMLVVFAKTPDFHVAPQAVRAEAAQVESRRCVAAG
jgi:penicillin V acylase-like amidase (Ntn superfamily)